MNINWTLKAFSELDPFTLYAILKLRSEVFVVEQNCVYLDLDDKDQGSHHLYGTIGDDLVAYVRILPPGLAYENLSSIGRVVSSPAYRRTGAGRLLMSKAIQETKILYPSFDIKIGAQLYLLDFYSSFGFQSTGDSYLEDGIPHIHMILTN